MQRWVSLPQKMGDLVSIMMPRGECGRGCGEEGSAGDCGPWENLIAEDQARKERRLCLQLILKESLDCYRYLVSAGGKACVSLRNTL